MGTPKVADLQMISFNVNFVFSSPLKRRPIQTVRALLANKGLLDTVRIVHVTLKPNVMIKHFAAKFTFNAQLISMWFHGRCSLFLFCALRFEVVDCATVTARGGIRCGCERDEIFIVIVSVSQFIAKRIVRRC